MTLLVEQQLFTTAIEIVAGLARYVVNAMHVSMLAS